MDRKNSRTLMGWPMSFWASMSQSHSTASSADDTATVLAVGALAATLASLCHETLGHGLGCIGAGGHIALLTSIVFRCSEWAAIADAGGPLGNLVAGSVALALLRSTRWSPTVRLFLLLFGALSLFWFTGQLTFESLSHRRDDWYWALQMGQAATSRAVGAVVGIGGYVLVGRVVSALNREHGGCKARTLRLAYVAAAASAVIAGLMWRPEPFSSALDGFLTLAVAPLGLLGVAGKASQDVGTDIVPGHVPRSRVWLAVCAVVFGLFLCIQARGLGPMAAARLVSAQNSIGFGS